MLMMWPPFLRSWSGFAEGGAFQRDVHRAVELWFGGGFNWRGLVEARVVGEVFERLPFRFDSSTHATSSANSNNLAIAIAVEPERDGLAT